MKEVVGKAVLGIVFLATFWFSSKPAEVSRSQSDGTLRELKIITQEDIKKRTPKYMFWKNRARKLTHFTLFAIAGAVAYLMTGSLKKSVVIVFIMGSIDEIHQYFILGRGAQVRDLVIDTFGGNVWAVFMRAVFQVKSKKIKFILQKKFR